MRADCRVGGWSNYLLGRFETTSVNEEVVLGCVSVADLGFKEKTRFAAICDQIVGYGGTLCLPEDGPVLREQYRDEQPVLEWLTLAMKPFVIAPDCRLVFQVGRGLNDLWLSTRCADVEYLFPLDELFVFRLEKRPLAS